MLVKPAEKMLKGKSRIWIAPDGMLCYLPFEALLSENVKLMGKVEFKKLPYLVKKYTISYTPSASVLKSLGAERKKGEHQRKLIAYADPVYQPAGRGGDGPMRAGYGETSGRLIYSEEEVRAIAQLYPQEEVHLYVREEASEENVKAPARLEAYEKIHFAMHALVNEDKPQFSSILLSTAEGSKEDGHLHMYEILNLKMNADLVVLSACESGLGLGQPVRGTGMLGLTRAFMYAGTKSVLVSLAKVEDKSTAELMKRFYKKLEVEKKRKDEALREAQLEMIASPYSHPYFWSPFVLYGP